MSARSASEAPASPARSPASAPDRGELERRMGQMITGAWVTQAIAVAADLAIADHLSAGPRSVTELARETGVAGPALRRLLRALASVGIFAEDDEGRFVTTALGALLARDAPGSKRSLAILGGAEFHRAWGGLGAALRTGKTAFDAVFGDSFFTYMGKHADRWRLYDEAMNGVHDAETGPFLDAYDLSDARSVVDVGGGNGRTLAGVLRRHPHLRGVLFDLPDVAGRARAELAAPDLAGRGTAVGGDFFASVPAGADVYLLRHVIHDWDEDSAAGILRRCAESMAPGGRVLVIESVIPPGNAPCFGKWLDLMMLVVGGQERTLEEYGRLFAAAGLRLARVVPTAHEVSVLEGRADA